MMKIASMAALVAVPFGLATCVQRCIPTRLQTGASIVRVSRAAFLAPAIAAVAVVPAVAAQPAEEGLFAVADVNRDTVPAGTPEAFEAAFGEKTRTADRRWHEARRDVGGQNVLFVPLTLIPMPEGRVALISTGAGDCGVSSCSGVNAVHYLRREGARYAVGGEWLDVGAGSAFGNPARRWGWTGAIAGDPVVYTEGGGVWQGYACSYASLTRLTPAGPVEIATIPVHYSNEGAAGDEADVVAVSGRIVAAKKDRSFTVRYTGARTYSERYVRGADGTYRLAGRSRAPRC
jgi:hypothetical protein